MNLLVFNLRTDLADTTLGFTTSWINGLARRCEHVVVVTMYKGVVDVEPNVSVHALSSSSRLSRARKVTEFYRLAHGVLRTVRIDVCFAHMTPHLAALFWPLSKFYRIPVLLWYAHGAVPLNLRIAHLLVDRCITSTPSGFRLDTDKLFVLGQGIDIEVFRPPALRGHDYERTALSVGRVTPRKRLEQIIESIALLRRGREDVRLVVTGGPVTQSDSRYEEAIRARAQYLEVDDLIHFEGAVPFHRVQDVYQRGAMFLNVSETDSLDKAILESMASGCVPISRNRSFAAIARAEGLEFLVPSAGPEGIAECVREVLRLPATETVALRQRLRRIVVERHSLDALMDDIRCHLEQLASGESGRADIAETKSK